MGLFGLRIAGVKGLRRWLLHSNINSNFLPVHDLKADLWRHKKSPSSDIAYLKRALFSADGGVEAKEIVEDVCKKLKVNIKIGGSTESRLERHCKCRR